MLKLMIVDDEKICRRGIRTCIYWDSYNIQIVAEAENGQDALEKAEACRPDIVITDIRMPIMDGIEFAQILKKRYPDVSLVVLSACSEFEYARAALKLQVDDYLLRPIRTQELTNCIRKIVEKLEHRNQHRTDLENMRLCLDTYNLSMRSQLMMRLLEGQNVSYDDLRMQTSVMKISLPRSLYRLVLIDIDLYDFATAAMPAYFWNHLILQMVQFLENRLCSVRYSVCFRVSGKQIGIIYPLAEISDIQDFTCMVTQLHRQLLEQYKNSISLLISEPFRGQKDLPKAYYQIRELELQKPFHAPGSILFYQDKARSITVGDYSSYEKRMLSAVKNFEFDELTNLWNGFSAVYRSNQGGITELRAFCYNLISKIWTVLESDGYLMADWMSHKSEDYFQFVFRIEFIAYLLDDGMPGLFRELEEFVASEKKSQKDQIINAAMDYMRHHYSEDISLDQVSQACYVSASHLSRLFTRNTDETFTNWLNRYRIEQAKKLFTDTEKHSVNEIAGLVGFRDYKYFSFVFKKIEGCLPSEYKEKSAGKEGFSNV